MERGIHGFQRGSLLVRNLQAVVLNESPMYAIPWVGEGEGEAALDPKKGSIARAIYFICEALSNTRMNNSHKHSLHMFEEK